MADDRARAKILFLAASDLASPAERIAYLEAACADDAELRARVEKLLAAYEGVGGFVSPDFALAPESTSAETLQGTSAQQRKPFKSPRRLCPKRSSGPTNSRSNIGRAARPPR
jgi:hypothetical protein